MPNNSHDSSQNPSPRTVQVSLGKNQKDTGNFHRVFATESKSHSMSSKNLLLMPSSKWLKHEFGRRVTFRYTDGKDDMTSAFYFTSKDDTESPVLLKLHKHLLSAYEDEIMIRMAWKLEIQSRNDVNIHVDNKDPCVVQVSIAKRRILKDSRGNAFFESNLTPTSEPSSRSPRPASSHSSFLCCIAAHSIERNLSRNFSQPRGLFSKFGLASTEVLSLRFASTEEAEHWFAALNDLVDLHDFKKFYNVQHVLGHGSYGIVHACEDKKTHELFAVKTIKVEDLEESKAKSLKRELALLKVLSHDNIVRTVDIFQDDKYAHIVMELMDGGTLGKKIEECGQKRKPFEELAVAKIMRAVFEGLKYLHSHGVVHRDLKPDNILLDTNGNIKLADFGLSTMCKSKSEREIITSAVGTPYFVAPEIFMTQQYTSKVDIWAAGVILFILLSGHKPFHGDTPQELGQSINEKEIYFKKKHWFHTSKESRELIKHLLAKDPDTRYDAGQALRSKWFKRFLPPASSVEIPIS